MTRSPLPQTCSTAKKGNTVSESTTYEPSPDERSRNQVALYEATDGAEGNTLDGRPVIVLTHTGAKSGLTRKTPLMQIEHAGSYAVVASNGGAAKTPLWANNIAANPTVQVQDGAVKHTLRAREVRGDEREQWWERAYATYPKFSKYRELAGRDIPLYVLEPVPGQQT
jgi:deazaflavin-dependent oxidoreductase (nitroreductase family)